MKQYLPIIQKVLPSVSEEDLIIPIKQTNIDSLDNIVIRATLERHFRMEISEKQWYQYETLSDALNYFHNNKAQTANGESASDTEISGVSDTEDIEIRMPQMANCALSEMWLLKYLGDKHWKLLSEGFDKKSSEFTDERGNRLYATFVRINYSTTSLIRFRENETVTFTSEIKGFGSDTFISSIKGKSAVNEINATLLSTFTARVNACNTNILRSNHNLKSHKIIQLSTIPYQLNDHKLVRKNLLDEISTDFGEFPNTDEILFTCEYEVNPFRDINGVGLLYFAAYPIISDSCSLKYFCDHKYYSYQTIYRDVFYFANCDPSDKIIFQINLIAEDTDHIRIMTSLYRKSDNVLLAKILTVKEQSM